MVGRNGTRSEEAMVMKMEEKKMKERIGIVMREEMKVERMS